MDSTRQLKVSRLIQKELAAIFLKEGKLFLGSAMVTVTSVRISPDLSFAKIYLSLFAVADREKLLKIIKENSPIIRKLLGQQIGKQVRIIPELTFFIDDTMDHALRIHELLKK